MQHVQITQRFSQDLKDVYQYLHAQPNPHTNQQ